MRVEPGAVAAGTVAPMDREKLLALHDLTGRVALVTGGAAALVTCGGAAPVTEAVSTWTASGAVSGWLSAGGGSPERRHDHHE